MADHTQAEFLGGLALVLMAFCLIVAGGTLVAATRYQAISGTVHVDQAGAASPGALPTPQSGDKPPPAQPKLNMPPAPSQTPTHNPNPAPTAPAQPNPAPATAK